MVVGTSVAAKALSCSMSTLPPTKRMTIVKVLPATEGGDSCSKKTFLLAQCKIGVEQVEMQILAEAGSMQSRGKLL